jgi:hypothetical protein
MATILSSSDNPIELCHDLLKYRCDSCGHVVQRRTLWLGTCCWLCLEGGSGCLCNWGRLRLPLLLCVLLRSTAAKDSPGVVWLEEKTLPVVVLGVLCVFLFRVSSLACLQPRELEGWGFSPSTNLQLQHVSIDVELPFSGHCAGDRPPPLPYSGEVACSYPRLGRISDSSSAVIICNYEL